MNETWRWWESEDASSRTREGSQDNPSSKPTSPSSTKPAIEEEKDNWDIILIKVKLLELLTIYS